MTVIIVDPQKRNLDMENGRWTLADYYYRSLDFHTRTKRNFISTQGPWNGISEWPKNSYINRRRIRGIYCSNLFDTLITNSDEYNSFRNQPNRNGVCNPEKSPKSTP